MSKNEMMNAKEFWISKYPDAEEDWGKTGHDDLFQLRMMEEYAEYRVKNCLIADVVGQNEQLNPDKELLDCIHNLMGYFDTPIARLKMQGKDCEEVRKIGREVLSKYNVDWRGV